MATSGTVATESVSSTSRHQCRGGSGHVADPAAGAAVVTVVMDPPRGDGHIVLQRRRSVGQGRHQRLGTGSRVHGGSPSALAVTVVTPLAGAGPTGWCATAPFGMRAQARPTATMVATTTRISARRVGLPGARRVPAAGASAPEADVAVGSAGGSRSETAGGVLTGTPPTPSARRRGRRVGGPRCAPRRRGPHARPSGRQDR